MLTDPISDMFVRIKNGLSNNEEGIVMPSSNLKLAILKVLKQEGYIDDFAPEENDHYKNVKIKFKYDNKKPTISTIKRISKPGLRIYTDYKHIPRPLQGFGLVILSTPYGLISGKEAQNKKVGGEVICEVY